MAQSTQELLRGGEMHRISRWRTYRFKFLVLSRCILIALAMLSCSFGLQATAQIVHSSQNPSGSAHVPGSPDDQDDAQRQMAKKLELRRNEDRQKQLVKDTNQLLALATDLKSEVDKTDKNVLSVQVIKKADEIEKLAKSVRDRMKYQ